MSAAQIAEVAVDDGRLHYKGAVMPYKPPIEKIVRLALVQMCNATPLESIHYWTRNEVSQEQLQSWEAQGVNAIDIVKYHGRFGSATEEFVVEVLGGEVDESIKQLVEIVNKNNQTGYLKGMHMSVAKLVRDLYELTDDADHHLQIINAALHVVHSFVRAMDPAEVVEKSLDKFEAKHSQLAAEFQKCNYGPFTLGRYARDMWALGTSTREINKRIAFWRDQVETLRAETARGEAEFRDAYEHYKHGRSPVIPMIEFELPAEGGRPMHCIWVQTDDRFVAGAVIHATHHLERLNRDVPKWEMRIIQGRRGNTAVSTVGLDLSAAANYLKEKEPGRWFYQPQTGALLNGGPQYIDVQPTNLRDQTLVIVFKFNSPKRKQQGTNNTNRQQSARRR